MIEAIRGQWQIVLVAAFVVWRLANRS